MSDAIEYLWEVFDVWNDPVHDYTNFECTSELWCDATQLMGDTAVVSDATDNAVLADSQT